MDDLDSRPTTANEQEQVRNVLARLGASTASEREAATDPGRGRYEIVDELGKGGMGVVFRARDSDLRRDVAMKVLSVPGGEDGTPITAEDTDPRQLGRFLEEAQVTGQLDHPGIVPIHELGLNAEGRLFFTMRLVRGRTLADVFELARKREDGWTTTKVLGVIQKVCEAMAYSHHKGVIHRDLKPANIMVGRFGESYVMDWGLAKVMDADGHIVAESMDEALLTRSLVHTDRKDLAESDHDSPLATLEGDVVGTPAYMAPEQAKGQLEKVGPRSDIYSVGALLYQLLTGQPPYVPPETKTSPSMVLRWVVEGPPTPISELASDVPQELVAICDKAMAREPEDRYATMLDVAEDLQAFIEDRVVRAYQTGAWAEFRKWTRRNKGLSASLTAAVLIAILGLAAVSWIQTEAKRSLADKNVELAEANIALESANREVREARDEAVANEQRALVSEQQALDQSYVANITAAVAALESGSAEAARRYLQACDPAMRGWEWHHLNLRSDTSLRVLGPHGSLVWTAVFTPDGQRVITAGGPFAGFGGRSFDVSIWDADTSELLRVLPGHDRTVDCMDVSPDGRRLVTGAGDNYVRIWDLETGRLQGVPRYLGGIVTETLFTSNGDRLVMVSADFDVGVGRVRVEDTRRLEVLLEAEIEAPATSAAVSPDSRWLAVGFDDSTIRLWDLDSMERVQTWEIPGRKFIAESGVALDGVSAIAFSPDGRRVASGSSDRRINVWDRETGRVIYAHALMRGLPSAVTYSPDGRLLVVGDSAGSVEFLEAESGLSLEVLNGHNQFLRSLDFSPDGSRLVSGSWDLTARIWDGRPGAASTVLPGDDSADSEPRTTEVSFSPDGRRVAWRPHRWSVIVSDAWSGENLFTLLDVQGAMGTVQYSLDGERLIVVSEVNGIQVFDAESGERLGQPTGPVGFPENLAFSPDQRLLTLENSSQHGKVRLMQVADGEVIRTLEAPEDGILFGEFTPDGTRFVAPCWDGTIRMWDVDSGEEVLLIDAPGQPWRLHVMPDGKRAVTSAWDVETVGLTWWDLETGEMIVHHPGRSIFVNFDVSADGNRAVSANTDGTIGLWDIERGELLHMSASASPMAQVAFDPTGTRIAGVDGGGRLRIWETVHPLEREQARTEAARRSSLVRSVTPLLSELEEELVFTRDIIEGLSTVDGLDAETRAAAIQSVRSWGDSPTEIIGKLWSVVLDRDRPRADYLWAARLANRAAEQWPDFHEPIAAAGAALYRLEQLEAAEQILMAANDTPWGFRTQGPRLNDAFLAMAYQRQGRTDEALFTFRRFTGWVERYRYDFRREESERVAAVLEEARELHGLE